MKIAVIQFGAGANKEQNIKKSYALVEEAIRARAKFILLPEVFIYRGKSGPKELQNISENIPGETTRLFSDLAKKHKVYILLGSLFEKSTQKKVYNTSVLINPQGKIQAKYRKIHLFDAKIGKHKLRESDVFLKGQKTTLTRVENFKVGMSICFDLRFPEMYVKYAQAGADVLLVPSAFTKKTGQAHWKSLLRARAIENQCYVLAPNQIGQDIRGVESYGHSMIVDPWGEVVVEAPGSKSKVIYATLKRQNLVRVKNVLNMRRQDRNLS